MKTQDFIIFLSIVLTLYAAVNFYIFLRGWQALPQSLPVRSAYGILFSFFALSYIAGRVTEHISVCRASNFFIWTGSFWLGMIVYLLLFILLFDILRAGNFFLHLFPRAIEDRYREVKLAAAIMAFVLSLLIVVAGHINTLYPKIERLSLVIPKKAGSIERLRIALATDIHLGTIISNSRVQTLVDGINGCNPDIVLLGGDIVDEDLTPVIQMNMGAQLQKIHSRYGTYAITGNHEFFGGVNAACRYMEEHGITVLRDRYVIIGGSFILAGRDDLTSARFSGTGRKPLQEILAGADRRLPIICMDHQPFGLEEAAREGVDLQLSGHTHNGQLWPFNYIIGMIYYLGRGYARIGDTHYYVSTGFGTWGPPVRTGHRPEILCLTLEFREGPPVPPR
ncbi:MAG: metallophosphoesterase [Spirochaetes bacterium]|nr:metallophosphoesterase [Spirochaetota bacterium]